MHIHTLSWGVSEGISRRMIVFRSCLMLGLMPSGVTAHTVESLTLSTIRAVSEVSCWILWNCAITATGTHIWAFILDTRKPSV